MYKIIITFTLLTACTTTPIERQRTNVLDCTKELMANNATAQDGYEICRQVYRLKKIGE